MDTKKGLIVLSVVLGILLLIAAIWGFNQNRQKSQALTENQELSSELTELNELKAELEQEVDSLQQEYLVLADENESLAGNLSDAEARLASVESDLRSARKRSASEINNLRAEIQALIEAKTTLETSIQQVQAENDSLRMVAGMLEEELGTARQENEDLAQLNRSIQDEVKRLTLANFKATAFQVDLQRKNDKATSKARRARTIAIDFDLTNVPEEYQGVRTLYLAITDSQGNPIPEPNLIKANVVVNGQTMELLAIKAKEVNIETNQRLSFTHELEDKLDKGYYRVAVYTDIGLLGASSFRLS